MSVLGMNDMVTQDGDSMNDEHVDVDVVAEDEVDVDVDVDVEQDHNAPKLDEEGLSEEYDIVICGTGLFNRL